MVVPITTSILAFATSSAFAMPILFDFNDVADGAGNSTVQARMQAVLDSAAPGMMVTVTGARGEKNYTGDNHVVGPVSGGMVTPLTLGNTDQGLQHALPWDSYLVNSTLNGNDRITMLFNRPIYAVAFDFQIFPDATCPNGGETGCPNTSDPDWPDFRLRAGSAAGTTEYFRVHALDPSMMTSPALPGEVSIVAPASPGLLESPISYGVWGKEKAPQLLALSGNWYFEDGVTKLEFIDWPRLIGIDNLRINLPEPGTLWLLGLGLGLGLWLRRGIRAAIAPFSYAVGGGGGSPPC